jgi:hypothetical protein
MTDRTSPRKTDDPRAAAQGGRLDVLAGVLAFAIPGLGHLYLGQKTRALYAAVGILGLFFGGLLIGGIDTVDSREDKWWFVGQSLVGPIAIGTNWIHQNQLKLYDIPAPGRGATPTGLSVYADELPLRFRSPHPNEQRRVETVTVVDRNSGVQSQQQIPIAVPAPEGAGPAYSKSVAKVNEIGTLYGLCAGMLNLIAILDALVSTRAPGHDNRAPGKAPPPRPAGRSDDDFPPVPKTAPKSRKDLDDPVDPEAETVPG